MAVIWADISALDLGLIPSGKRVDAETVSVNLYCSRIYISLFLSSFLFYFSLLLLSDSRFYLFIFFTFISFSFLYSNSLSHIPFFLSSSLSLSVFPFHFHHALSQPCTTSVDHPRPYFLHLVTDARCTAGACIIVCDFGCAFVYAHVHIRTWREWQEAVVCILRASNSSRIVAPGDDRRERRPGEARTRRRQTISLSFDSR